MKVLQITTNYPCKENPIYGIFVKEQVDSVEKFGVENTIVFSNGLKSNPRIKFSGSFIYLRTAWRLFWHLRTHKYDVIHCHNALSGLILQIAGGINNRNTVLSLQSDPETSGSMDQRLSKRLYRKFAKLIVKKQLKKQKEKFVYLPNGVNLKLFRPLDKTECKKELRLDLNKRYILFVDSNTLKGRPEKRKDRFDDVLKILREKYGHTDIEELVMTHTSRDDVPKWMNACEMYLLSSDTEGSPNAVKECMACNVPVVATPVGNIPELFENIDGCRMSADLSAEALAECANAVLCNSGKVNTRQRIIDMGLDIDSIAKRLFALYQDLAKNH